MWYLNPVDCDHCPRRNTCNSCYGAEGCGWAVEPKKESWIKRLFKRNKTDKK